MSIITVLTLTIIALIIATSKTPIKTALKFFAWIIAGILTGIGIMIHAINIGLLP